MTRDELLDLCERYVRRRGLMDGDGPDSRMPPVVEIIDGYLHAEISESEKNSLLSYVRGTDHDPEDEDRVHELDDPVLAELDDVTP